MEKSFKEKFIPLYDLKWFLKLIDQTNPKLQPLIKYINVLLHSNNAYNTFDPELIKKSTQEFLNEYQSFVNPNLFESEAPDELKMLLGYLSVIEDFKNFFDDRPVIIESIGIDPKKFRSKISTFFEAHPNNPFALSFVGFRYYFQSLKLLESDPINGPKDDQKEGQKKLQLAHTYFLKAALKGYAPAQYNLGFIEVLTPNFTKRRNYLHLSADQGYAPAENVLGALYKNTPGERDNEQNREKTFLYIKRAAAQGNVEAIYNYAHCFNEGFGVTQSLKEFWKQLNVIAKGCLPAKCSLASCYLTGRAVSEDVAKAFSILTEACKEDSAEAMEMLAELYASGRKNANTGEVIVPLDDTRSHELYHQAATKGRGFARQILANRYQEGRGVQKDLVQAQYWYKQCLESNDVKNNKTWAEQVAQASLDCEIQLHWEKEITKVSNSRTLEKSDIDTIRNLNPVELINNLKSKIAPGSDPKKHPIHKEDLEAMVINQLNKAALKRCFDPLVKEIKISAEHYEVILTVLSKWEVFLSKKNEIAFLIYKEDFKTAFKNKTLFQKQKFHPKKIIEFLQYASTLPKSELTPDNIQSILLKYSNYALNRAVDEERRLKRKSERESADYLNKINDLYGKIVCFPIRFNNYIKDEFKLSQKMDAVKDCVKSVQFLLQERNELLTKHRFKIDRQEKNRPNEIKRNDEMIKETNALLEAITGNVQNINEVQKTFTLSYDTDLISIKQLLTEGELQKSEKFLQDLEGLLDSCKKEAAKFTENFDELKRIKKLIEDKRQEEGKRDKVRLFIGSDPSEASFEEEKKSQEEIHENREAAFNWMYRLDRILQVTYKKSETIEKDAEYHKKLQEERRARKALAMQERDDRLQRKKEEAEKVKEEAEKTRKEKEEKGNAQKGKEASSKSKELVKERVAPSVQQLEVLFATDISFEIESEVKTRKEPESFNTRIPGASKFFKSFGFSNSSKPSKKRTLESLTDLGSEIDVYDQLAILETTLKTIPYEDKMLTQLEATIINNALLGVCARGMECLKKLRIHGLVFPEMARQFRNVVFHSSDQSIIPIMCKASKANQENLNQLRDMSIKLLSYLNSDQFKKMRHDHHDLAAKELDSEDPIDPKTQILNSIDSLLFTKIILSTLSQEKDLKTCQDMLKLSDQELDSYKNYRNTASKDHLALQSLLPMAEGFTQARISTYASYMKWHGDKRYRVIYNQFPKEKRAFYEKQIEAGKRFRHGKTM